MVDGGGCCHRHDNHIYPSPPPPPPLTFHLLEITIISAQDLHLQSRSMSTYASAWVNSEHKLKTHTDIAGRNHPSWNDKFIFRVDESFLRSDTSAVTVDIFSSARFFKDPIIGTARVVLSAINPSSSTRFVALQVRRPKSLRPQGIINIGVSLLDAYIHNMPLDPAFIIKDIVKSSHGGDKANENGEEWKLERNLSVEVGRRVWELEAEELESKLEKWRIDLTPLQDLNRGKHRRSRTLSCLCCGCVKE